MKLHMFPASTTCRPILLFCAEYGIDVETIMVDLMSGAHHQEPFASLFPAKRVPVLEDGDFVLTEGSAILKYLATLHAPDAYPDDAQKRARINSRMDWFNTGLYMDFGYNLVYPQTLPHYKRDSDVVQAATLKLGQDKSREWLTLLDQHLIGPDNDYVCGDQISIADYLGSGYLTLGELIGIEFSEYPNVSRWLATMKSLPNWRPVHEAFDGWAASLEGQAFTRLS